jgi:hypothetical protein
MLEKSRNVGLDCVIVDHNYICSFLEMIPLQIQLRSKDITLQIASAHSHGITKEWLISLYCSLQRYLEIHLNKDPVIPQVI